MLTYVHPITLFSILFCNSISVSLYAFTSNKTSVYGEEDSTCTPEKETKFHDATHNESTGTHFDDGLLRYWLPEVNSTEFYCEVYVEDSILTKPTHCSRDVSLV